MMINPGVTSWRTTVCLGRIVTFQLVVCKGFLNIHVMNEWRFIDTTTRFHCIILNVLLSSGVLNILLFPVNKGLLLHFLELWYNLWFLSRNSSCHTTILATIMPISPNFLLECARYQKWLMKWLAKIVITLGITGPEMEWAPVSNERSTFWRCMRHDVQFQNIKILVVWCHIPFYLSKEGKEATSTRQSRCFCNYQKIMWAKT